MLNALIVGVLLYFLIKDVQATAAKNAERNSVAAAVGITRPPVNASPILPVGSLDINGDAIARTAQNSHYLAPPLPTPIFTLRPITAALPSAPGDLSGPIEFAGRMALKGMVE